MREWRRLTVENISLEKENNEEVNQDDEEEKTRVKVLNELDFNEYVVSGLFIFVNLKNIFLD